MDQPDDDALLIRAMAGGDAKALERLFTRHQTRVFRYLVRMLRDEAMAEDVMNDVFMAAWQGAAKYEGRSAASTWLISIAHNKAISMLRKRRESTGIDDDAVSRVADEDDTPDVTVAKQDKAALMRAAIAALSDDHRTIIDLVYYQEQSVAEAAEVLGIPEATVKTRMFYARKRLGEIMKDRGLDRGWP